MILEARTAVGYFEASCGGLFLIASNAAPAIIVFGDAGGEGNEVWSKLGGVGALTLRSN